MLTKSYDVLLIEDNSGDAILVEEAFRGEKKERFLVNLSVVVNGEQAVDFLGGRGAFLHASVPDLIILDLNLPQKNGFEILEVIRQNEMTRGIPVIVLTTSKSPDDVLKCYSLGATCFITKPFGFHQFMQTAKAIKDFWLDLVTLPARN